MVMYDLEADCWMLQLFRLNLKYANGINGLPLIHDKN